MSNDDDRIDAGRLREVLAPWFSDEPAEGDRVPTPREAAFRALELALNTDEQRGIIRVIATEAEARRQVRNYLEAFLADTPKLKPLLKRVTADAIHLTNDITIAVAPDDKRKPKHLIATITLDPSEVVNPARRDLARAILSAVTQHGPDSPEVVKMRKVLGPEFDALLEHMATRPPPVSDWDAEWQFLRAAKQAPVQTSGVPVLPRAPETPEELMEAQQEADRTRKEMRGWDRGAAPKVIRRRPDK